MVPCRRPRTRLTVKDPMRTDVVKPVGIVTTHPIQYQVPLFRYLSERGLPLRVFYLSDQGLKERHDVGFGREIAWDIDLLGGYEHKFLANLRSNGRAEDFFGLVNPALLREISSQALSAVVVHGY